MKKSCLFFLDKKYKCVSFIVHYTGLTLKRCSKKECCKHCRHVKFTGTMKK